MEKDIIWYEWEYGADSYGNIYSYKKNKIKLKQYTRKDWYEIVNLCKDWKGRTKSVHQLVMLAFHWKNNWLDVNHKNWIHNDNKLENLEYCTRSENIKHSYRKLGRKSVNKWKFWKNHHYSKQVKQLDLNWNLIKIWDSLSDVYRELWIHQWNITKACEWKRLKSAGWYKWEFII